MDSPEDPAETAPPETMSRTTLDKLTLPPYNAKDPKLWFKQAEDAFALVKNTAGQLEIGQQKVCNLDDLVEHYKKHPIFKQEAEKLFLVQPFECPTS